PPIEGDENHIALSVPEFRVRQAGGAFAMYWEAHGLFYGVGREIELWQRAGLVVVVSGSRAHFERVLATAADIAPILVTCAPDVLARRLAQRGRESEQAIAERLHRSRAVPLSHPALVTIDNSGSVEQAGERLVALLRDAARRAQPAGTSSS
ncbi:MAG TPA: phosphonate metabolism protein/1,5-bisphosphokinase (PRPP-forming) PhnN, partial [Alphaproteobacteria bacterium]|nr:phosphonate metabolism protein/1,5-bisphosphokinase (PRPP-forming) PhnN [Alphaproteobacteria bacterium]